MPRLSRRDAQPIVSLLRERSQRPVPMATEEECLLRRLEQRTEALRNGKDYKPVALAMLSNSYNYDNSVVLFKPTLTFGDQTFRLDNEGASAYFIGGNPK